MQFYAKFILSIAVWCALTSNAYAGKQCPQKQADKIPELVQVWQAENLSVPESVLEVKDKRDHYFLVSLIDGDPFTKDGIGGVAKISASGEIIDDKWVTGLSAPKGMAVYKNWLYVADIDEVVAIDLHSPDIRISIPVPGAIFLNDVAVDKRGSVYVSDTGAGQIIRIKKGVPELYLDDVSGANGLYAHKNGLLIGAGPDLLFYKHNKQPEVLSSGLPYGIDGVAPTHRGNTIVSVWEGQIYWISKNGEETLLLDSIDEGINTADFAYSRSKNLLVVPNFFSNTVTAYKLR